MWRIVPHILAYGSRSHISSLTGRACGRFMLTVDIGPVENVKINHHDEILQHGERVCFVLSTTHTSRPLVATSQLLHSHVQVSEYNHHVFIAARVSISTGWILPPLVGSPLLHDVIHSISQSNDFQADSTSSMKNSRTDTSHNAGGCWIGTTRVVYRRIACLFFLA